MTTFHFPQTSLIVSDSRCGVTSAFNSIEEFKAAMLECGWAEPDFDAFMASDPEVFEAECRCHTKSGGAIYHVDVNGRHTYYAVAGGVPSTDVKLVLDLDHEAEPEELGEAGGVMLMNPATGSVAPESGWRETYANSTPEEWGGQEFEDAQLEEVVLNQPGQPGYDEGYGDWRPYDA